MPASLESVATLHYSAKDSQGKGASARMKFTRDCRDCRKNGDLMLLSVSEVYSLTSAIDYRVEGLGFYSIIYASAHESYV